MLHKCVHGRGFERATRCAVKRHENTCKGRNAKRNGAAKGKEARPNCPNCGGSQLKNGLDKEGNQRYRCKACRDVKEAEWWREWRRAASDAGGDVRTTKTRKRHRSG